MKESYTVSDRHREIVDMVSDATKQIQSTGCDYIVIITLPNRWKLHLLYDMASSGGLICIDEIETPAGERINDDNMELSTWWWLNGFIEGLTKA